MKREIFSTLYAAVAPWLALSLLFIGRNPRPALKRSLLALSIAALILVVPIGGFSLVRWIAVLEASPSFTLTALLAIALWQRLGSRILFRSCDWKAAWIFGSAAALVLYPMGLGLTSIDPYVWGWEAILPLVTAGIATVLLLRGNRFGIILILCMAGFFLSIQESHNFWDALIDPVYGIISLVTFGVMLIKRKKEAKD